MLLNSGRPLRIGISPCPNDTYIFEALLHKRINVPFVLEVVIADVEQLNNMTREGLLDISKISMAAIPDIWDEYALLDSGSALGWGCGPLLVAKKPCRIEDLEDSPLVIPGELTTANLLLSLNGVCKGPRKAVVFDEIMGMILSGEVEAGVIIHEGRFTYAKAGLNLVQDLGKWWENFSGLPIPLGGIVIKRSLGIECARVVQEAIAASLCYANDNPEVGKPFIEQNAQEMDPAVMAEHIKTFVNGYSLGLGQEGRRAVQILVEKAAELKGLSMPEQGIFVD